MSGKLTLGTVNNWRPNSHTHDIAKNSWRIYSLISATKINKANSILGLEARTLDHFDYYLPFTL